MQTGADGSKTAFTPPRGYGLASAPDVGPESLPLSVFLTQDDITNSADLAYAPDRVFLGRCGGQMIGLKDNRHLAVFGGSRSGKTATFVISNLLLSPSSAFVVDPKGELAEATAAHRERVHGHRVVILDPFGMVKGEAARYVRRHNLLREIDALGRDFIDDAAAMVEALVVDGGGDQHWTLSGRNMLASLILMAKLEDGPQSLSDLRGRLARDPAALWDDMKLCARRKPLGGVQREALDLLADQASSYAGKNPNELASIVSSALEQLSFAQSPAMRALFDGHDVDLADLKAPEDGRPLTLYVVLPASRMETHNRWLRALVTMALLQFERLPTKRDAPPIIMLLEEFAALGHLRPVEQAIGYIASYGVRIFVILQDVTQLQRHHKDGWQTFIANAGVTIAMSVSDMATCEYLSKRLGDTTMRVTNKHSVSESQVRSGDLGERYEFRTVPLMTPAELAIAFAHRPRQDGAPEGPMLVIRPGWHPFAVERVFWKDLV